MKITAQGGDYRIECSAAEYEILCAALNNIEEKVDRNEYTTLMGATESEINAVRSAVFAART